MPGQPCGTVAAAAPNPAGGFDAIVSMQTSAAADAADGRLTLGSATGEALQLASPALRVARRHLMCLVAFAIGASRRWPLVIAANRDEFLERPTLPLARWKTASGQEIISGRDLRAGGTWMGITPAGRIAFPDQCAAGPARGRTAFAR